MVNIIFIPDILNNERSTYHRPYGFFSHEEYYVFQVENTDEMFRISLDMSHFCPDEITLKTKNGRVVVHAKHGERTDDHGIVEREFQRQYVLPKVSSTSQQ